MRILVFVFISIASSVVLGATYTGKINKMEFGPVHSDLVYVDVVGDQSPKASCVTDATFNYGFDISTTVGKAVFTALLAALTTQRDVTISGENVCTVANGVEDIRWVEAR